MYKFVGKTCSGKTKNLLLAAEREGGIVVCRNPERMTEKAHSLGIVGLRIIHYTEVKPNGEPYFIDDLEAYVSTAFGSGFVGYTLSCDD